MTIKQKLFIQEYLRYRNATQAALDVYDAKNKNSAAVIGYRLLRNVNVKSEIERILEARESTPSYIAKLLIDVIENGSSSQKIKALQMTFKLYGLG